MRNLFMIGNTPTGGLSFTDLIQLFRRESILCLTHKVHTNLLTGIFKDQAGTWENTLQEYLDTYFNNKVC